MTHATVLAHAEEAAAKALKVALVSQETKHAATLAAREKEFADELKAATAVAESTSSAEAEWARRAEVAHQPRPRANQS